MPILDGNNCASFLFAAKKREEAERRKQKAPPKPLAFDPNVKHEVSPGFLTPEKRAEIAAARKTREEQEKLSQEGSQPSLK